MFLTVLHGSVQVEEKSQTFSAAFSLVPEQEVGVAEKSQALRRKTKDGPQGDRRKHQRQERRKLKQPPAAKGEDMYGSEQPKSVLLAYFLF